MATQNTNPAQDAGWRGKFAGFAVLLSVFSALWFVVAAFGTKFGLWTWQTGLGTMTIGIGPLLVMGALLVAVIALVIALIKAPRKQAAMLALLAILIAGLALGRLAGMSALAAGVPPIHDVQTDWSNPVQPTDGLLAKRRETKAENPIENNPVIPEGVNGRWPGFGGKTVAEAQESAEFDAAKHKASKETGYPTLATLISPLPYADTFEAARAVVNERGWEVVTANAETGIIEATETSFFFGFKDDVMIRVSILGSEARIDVRSTSRVGLSDLGANAKRAGNLVEDIRRKVNSAAP
jgi:uncharacterized protein (DUF1499 family)